MKSNIFKIRKMQPDAETSFFIGMTKLYYGLPVKKKLQRLASKIPWAKDWPHDDKAFWEAEAFMWQYKIDKKIRDIISKELSFLKSMNKNDLRNDLKTEHSNQKKIKRKKLNNLDLGCGAYSYLPSVGFDFSKKMLLFNENCHRKIQGDLEKKLPFSNQEFSSVTAIFVLNYIKNINQLLAEIYRILRNKGFFITILSEKEISSWPAQKVVNRISFQKWKTLFKKHGFKVKTKQKQGLLIFQSQKLINK